MEQVQVCHELWFKLGLIQITNIALRSKEITAKEGSLLGYGPYLKY